MDNLYYYQADLIRVVDGDTVYVKLHLGLSISIDKFKIRLARINAPELRDPAGEGSRIFVDEQMTECDEIRINTLKGKKDKYGRYLCEIHILQGEKWINLNDLIVKKGYAAAYRNIEAQMEEFIY